MGFLPSDVAVCLFTHTDAALRLGFVWRSKGSTFSTLQLVMWEIYVSIPR
jgi:hypothetical protein